MRLLLICLSLLVCLFTSQQDMDLVDITKIKQFPNYDHNIRAGYLNVSGYQQAFYYIFCESQSGSLSDPVILWLNGGPGCSSLTGFFTQNGPFVYKEQNDQNMVINQYAWNQNAHVLYLQSPGTVGFSTASTKYRTASDSSVAKDNLKAVQLFFDRYGYRSNEFYIAGQSYAGIYIPRLAQEILIYNEGAQDDARINLKGILLGNACTHPYECSTNKYYSRFTTQFFYTRGFIEQNQYKQYKSICLNAESSASCVNLQSTIYQNFINSGANIYNIYAKCYKSVYPPKNSQISSVYQQKLEAFHKTPQGLKHPLRCTDSIRPITLLNTNQYRAVLKIGELNDTLFWTPCSDTLKYTIQSKATYFTIPTLINAGLKVFYYSGDTDAIVPIQGTLFWFNKYRSDYKMPIKRSWRPWVTNSQNISGMLWQLDKITLATIRGAGHMVPSDKPVEAYQILNVFLGRKQWKLPDYYVQMTH